MMRIGVRAHDFGRLPAGELAAKIAAQGLCCVQLALSKAIAGLDLKPGSLNPGVAFDIGQAFLRQGVQVAVLGCYVNPIHPDLQTRGKLLEFFKEHLRFARDFGCSVVALETGSVDADYQPHADNHGEAAFAQTVESFAALAAEAEKFGVMVGVEAVTSHVISTPQKMRRLLDAVGSNNLQVVFDPVNLLSLENHLEQERIIKESFELFGERIVIIHAKDFVVEHRALRPVRAGQGSLNHDLLLGLIAQRKAGISILLEEVNPQTVAESVGFIQRVAAKARPDKE